MTGTRTIAVIVVAAGRGERASSAGDSSPKQYRDLAGTPVLSRSIAAFLGRDDVSWVVPVIHSEQLDRYAALGLNDPRLLPPVTGGETRQASVLAGLTALSARRPDLVLIQDAARPLVSSEVIGGVIEALRGNEAAPSRRAGHRHHPNGRSTAEP